MAFTMTATEDLLRSLLRKEGRSLRMRIKVILCIASVALVASMNSFKWRRQSSTSIAMTLLQATPHMRATSSSSRQLQQSSERPVMHTFYNPIDSQNKPAGMTHDAHGELIEVWKKAWSDAGWEPRVLTLKDAELHIDYRNIKNVVDTLPTGEYNKLCFLRWVAMASVGGGWMCDYDVLPLHDFRNQVGEDLPFSGSLTVHDGLCPSMVSGSANEWLRLAKRLVEHADQKQIDSDQKTLVSMYRRTGPTMFHSMHEVLEGFLSRDINWDSEESCRVVTPVKMRGAHFAHSNFGRAKQMGRIPEDFNMDERPRVAKEWLEMWLQKCGGRKVFVNET